MVAKAALVKPILKKWWGIILVGITVVVVGGWLFMGGSGSDKFIITMTSSGFSPSEITIRTGQTIEFDNKSDSDRWPASNIHPTHEIYPEFDPGRPVLSGQQWSFKFDQRGIWRFHDHLFPNMIGNINVE